MILFLTLKMNILFADEVPSLTIEQWNAAKTDKWIDKQHFNELKNEEKEVIKSYKIHFPQTKGSKYGGLIFPKDTHRGMDMLCSPEIRQVANIDPSNLYAFPTKGQTSYHVQGPYAIRQVAIGA